MRRALAILVLATGLGAPATVLAGPVSAGQGMGPLGPRGSECAPGSEAAGRPGCRPFRSNDLSRRGDIRCAERPTLQGFTRFCRD